ncbi:hypothetical protein PR048_017198 [Dryococelus australis]|uniref:HAT C-terminal dimerisation domain-containing protein n=1 Tax=Dryococelus australis TaxID=614101 RepID=A0ABQ9H8V2_9NEOP|nr:hypothetical protein PR048_017198 [Dryococelus australis]
MHPETRSLFPELEKLLCYLMVTPVTSATAESSLSTLRILKSYILNSLCILNVYGKLTDDLNIEKLISEFVNKNEYRSMYLAKNN